MVRNVYNSYSTESLVLFRTSLRLGPQEIKEAQVKLSKEILVGVWSLDEFIIHRESGEMFNWPGKQNGTLIYTDNGFVSVAQNRDPLTNPTDEDKKRESNFYTATYELDVENNRVFHFGLQSSVKSVIGERLEREVKLLKDGRLWLSGKGLKERVTLVWSKVDTTQTVQG